MFAVTRFMPFDPSSKEGKERWKKRDSGEKNTKKPESYFKKQL